MANSAQAAAAALLAAQQAINRGDPGVALDRLESLPSTARTAPVLRLQGLCLLLLDRLDDAQALAAAAQSLHPSYPYALLQTADLAWHRRDHWPALLACLDALLHQPKLHNLWRRVFQITTALGSTDPSAVVPAAHYERFRELFLSLVDQLLGQPSDQRLVAGLAHLLPLLPPDPHHPHRHPLLVDHCRHAQMALQALDRLD